MRKLLGKEVNMLQDLCQAVKKPIWDLNDILVRGAKVQRAWEAENLMFQIEEILKTCREAVFELEGQ